jgi:membrane-anchored mycosin MYCP
VVAVVEAGGRGPAGRRRLPLRVAVVLVIGLAVLVPGGVAHADTVRQLQWYLRELKVDQAHRISTGAGVVVGLVDSGVEATHPDLRGHVTDGPRFDSTSSSRATADVNGHGTTMAGVIVGQGGGPDHVAGIAPGATVLSVQALVEGGNLAAGILWAVDHRATVLNLSFYAGRSAALEQAVGYALSKDVVVVAAAGNTVTGQSGVGFPAEFPGVIAVSGTSRGGRFWDGSVSGGGVVLSAPADGIVTTASRASGFENGIASGSGTSEATAIVSGAAALVRAAHPELSAPDVISRLIRTADDAGPAGRDPEYGFGRLDILAALTTGVPHVTRNPLGTPLTAEPTTTTTPATTSPATTSPTTIRPTTTTRPPPRAAEPDTSSGVRGAAIGEFVFLGALVLVLLSVPIILMIGAARGRRRARIAAVQAARWYPHGRWGPPGGGHSPDRPPPAAYPVPRAVPWGTGVGPPTR